MNKAIAYHIGDFISIAEILHYTHEDPLRVESGYAFYELSEKSWVYIKDYGSVVFINCEELIQKKWLKLLIGQTPILEDLIQEEYNIQENHQTTRVGFSVIKLDKLNPDEAHVICLHIGQAVALDDFQNQVNDLLELTRGFSCQLDQKGKLGISRKEMRRLVGQTMVLKNKIAENLFIFDTPDVSWNDEELNQLDTELRRELEILRRHQGLQLNLSVVKENIDLFKDILQHRHSSILEWIIILLILFEVIQVFIP
ncbi:MAG: putative Rmd1/YagE family protein [Arenicella sp.]|jgi:uncharacterized Rmd1/YagE family protein